MIKRNRSNFVAFILFVSIFISSSCIAKTALTQKQESCTIIDPAVIQLQYQLDSLVCAYHNDNFKLGIVAKSVDKNELLYSLNADQAFVPASNLKLLTSAIALQTLGKDFRWNTTFYTDGIIKDSILAGNLIVKTEGDPAISKSLLDIEVSELFKLWSDSLRTKGIAKVSGDLIIDNSAFAQHKIGSAWKDSNKLYAYAAIPSTFAINENYLQVRITGNRTLNKAPIIEIYPPNIKLKIVNNATTANIKRNTIRLNRNDDNTIYLSGKIARNQKISSVISMANPADYAKDVLFDSFNTNRLSIAGKSTIIDTCITYYNKTELYNYQSPQLAHIIKRLNKDSNNFIANQVYLSLGYQLRQSVDESENIIKEYLQLNQIEADSLFLDDGSGLSPINKISPNNLTDLLVAIHNKPFFSDFFESLTIAGVDGTLKDYMHYYPLYNNFRGKTGTLDRVRTLSGYVYNHDNELLCFSFFCNDFNGQIKQIDKFKEDFLIILANFERTIKPNFSEDIVDDI
ncbi:MAG: D-alanyl-D-alanine carboxypeptidase/D-alanyl-D-alanine-endopeptidase [Candidatus Cloacimonadales bacterium]